MRMDEADGAAGSRSDVDGGADLAMVWARAARTVQNARKRFKGTLKTMGLLRGLRMKSELSSVLPMTRSKVMACVGSTSSSAGPPIAPLPWSLSANST